MKSIETFKNFLLAPAMSTFNSLLRKATSLLKISGFDASPKKVPLDGEVTFCKNNVCVHPPTCLRTDVAHHPGYLTIREQVDEVGRIRACESCLNNRQYYCK